MPNQLWRGELIEKTLIIAGIVVLIGGGIWLANKPAPVRPAPSSATAARPEVQSSAEIKLPPLHLDAEEQELPPYSERKSLGTWTTTPIAGPCTRSFEEVDRKVYDVKRCSSRYDGRVGTLVDRIGPKKFKSRISKSGVYYVILASGELSVRDPQGQFAVEPIAPSLMPEATAARATTNGQEDHKTASLGCLEIGFRFGKTATLSMNGAPTNPEWDFVVPDRCKTAPELKQGIKAGIKAAS